jgi:hypothetical protein
MVFAKVNLKKKKKKKYYQIIFNRKIEDYNVDSNGTYSVTQFPDLNYTIYKTIFTNEQQN